MAVREARTRAAACEARIADEWQAQVYPSNLELDQSGVSDSLRVNS